MNAIAKQLRTNADFVLQGTGLPPDAAIAGALQMGADEIDRLTGIETQSVRIIEGRDRRIAELEALVQSQQETLDEVPIKLSYDDSGMSEDWGHDRNELRKRASSLLDQKDKP